MLRVDAQEYLELGRSIQDMRIVYQFIDSEEGKNLTADTELVKSELNGFRELLQKTMGLCTDLGLRTSSFILAKRLSDLPRTGRELDIVLETVTAELTGQIFLALPPEKASLYECEDILSLVARGSFPLACKELVQAASAYALGLNTACVFHSMRAAEIGLRVLGIDLEVSFPAHSIELAEWHSILEQAESKIRAMSQGRKDDRKAENLKFYSDAAMQFRYFKDAWRVRVAHARESYDESQAARVLEHTREFFESLSPRLQEPTASYGNPILDALFQPAATNA